MKKTKSQTIFALSTPTGKSGLAVIRISGDRCKYIIQKICKIDEVVPRFAKLVNFHGEKDQVIDRGLLLYFEAPKSFTGEEMAEFHVHGSLAVIKIIMNKLSSIKHTRAAFPGEFSKKAFQNNKIGLSNLEGINNLIDSETELEHRVSIGQAFGGPNKRFLEWRDMFIEISSLIDSQIEFYDEGPSLINEDIFVKIQTLKKKIEMTISNYENFSQIREGIPILIFGPPNTGKSSLFNLINNNERSIVSEIKGTTRDLVSSCNDFEGTKVNLIDSAGLHDSKDRLEKIGIDRTREMLKNCTKMILVLSPDKQNESSINSLTKIIEKSNNDIIVFFNKSEKPNSCKEEKIWKKKVKGLKKLPSLRISCKAQKGNKTMYTRVLDFIYRNLLKKLSNDILDSPFTELRQIECLKKSNNHLICGLEKIDHLEILAEEIRLSRQEFEKIIGNIDDEEKLDYIFKKFCIGK